MKSSARRQPRIADALSEPARVQAARLDADQSSPWKPFEDRRRDRDVKREAVLLTAARLFIEVGYARATLADVAERLHITKPALYHYFHGKEEILFECYRLGQEMVDAALGRIAGQETDGLGKVRAYIGSYVETICVDPGAIMVRVDDRELSAEPRGQVRRWKADIDRSLRGFVAEGIADGSIAPCDAKIAAFAIGGALNWIGHWYRPDGEFQPSELASRYADLLTNGLAVREDPTTDAKRVRQPRRSRRTLPEKADTGPDQRAALPGKPGEADLSRPKRPPRRQGRP